MKLILLALLSLALTYAAAQDRYQNIRECIVENGTVKEVTVDYNTTTAAKSVMVQGVRKAIDEIYPYEGKEYAAKKEWFVGNKTITVGPAAYKKYGLPRVFGINETQKLAVYDGIQVFEERGTIGVPEVIYLPVRRGCEFQPYQFANECATELKLAPSVKEVKPGEKVVVTATLPATKGKYLYQWEVIPGTIIGDTTGKTVTIRSDASSEDDMQVNVWVTLKDAYCTRKAQFLTIPVLTKRFVSKATRTPVKVLNWDKVPIKVDSAFWNKEIEQQVLKQLSPEEYQYAKTHSSYTGWAAPVKSLMDWRSFSTDKLASLKTYQVAAFDIVRGKNVGKAVIIVVPYEENKEVLKSSKPLSDFYFLHAAAAIRRTP